MGYFCVKGAMMVTNLLRIIQSILFSVLLTVLPVNSSHSEIPETIDVVIKTSLGSIEVELYLEKAPITVYNFLRYLDRGYYNRSSFYRTVRLNNDNGKPKIEVIQGGIGQVQKPFPMIKHESTKDTGLSHLDGTISMSRGAIDTATSDFFICIGNQIALDYGGIRNKDGQGFSAFGRVVSGMNIVKKIHAMPSNKSAGSEYVKGQMLDDPVIIEGIERL
tara:strand:- start:1754 stop:2410 length:657 start_codon:yes stop_codon:yes gene_type:complete